MLRGKILQPPPAAAFSVLPDASDDFHSPVGCPWSIVGITQDLSPQRIHAVADVMPRTGLRYSAPELAEGEVHDLQAVQIVKAMQDVNAFCLAPWEPLGQAEVVLCRPLVGESDDTKVDVDNVSQLILQGFIVGSEIRQQDVGLFIVSL